jgi:hypothetical protein
MWAAFHTKDCNAEGLKKALKRALNRYCDCHSATITMDASNPNGTNKTNRPPILSSFLHFNVSHEPSDLLCKLLPRCLPNPQVWNIEYKSANINRLWRNIFLNIKMWILAMDMKCMQWLLFTLQNWAKCIESISHVLATLCVMNNRTGRWKCVN